MFIITTKGSRYYQMARKGAKKALPPTGGYNRRKVNSTGTQGSWSQSSFSSVRHCRKFRTHVGGPSTSTSMVWRPKMPTTPTTTMVWRPKIPDSWEMKYCEEEGSIPWEQIVQGHALKEFCDKKKKKTWDWDASSGEEALEKAKARYWCRINGFPFESLTNEEYADMNVDKDIEWNPVIEPEISLALDRRYDNDVIINEGKNVVGSESSDDNPKWLTEDYLLNKDKKVSKGWGTEFND
ncbi:hypothetical protein MKX01_010570 [Papaver californicum]|nr:hypothetical protein MKX01_010570 [Papaver californicum]